MLRSQSDSVQLHKTGQKSLWWSLRFGFSYFGHLDVRVRKLISLVGHFYPCLGCWTHPGVESIAARRAFLLILKPDQDLGTKSGVRSGTTSAFWWSAAAVTTGVVELAWSVADMSDMELFLRARNSACLLWLLVENRRGHLQGEKGLELGKDLHF